MDAQFTSRSIPNKMTARAVFIKMRRDGASPYEFGLFYRAMLKRRLWSSQRDLAQSLGVSTGNISRVIAFTRIPVEVVKAMGGVKRLSFRTGERLLDAIDRTGESILIARAREATRLGYTSIDDFLEFVVSDRIPRPAQNKIQVRLARDRQSLRVEILELDRLLPHLSRLETFLVSAFVMFEASLGADRAVAAENARNRLTREKQSPGSESMRPARDN